MLYSSIFFLILCISNCISLDIKTNVDDLIAVVQIYRHGQRNPVNWYKNDPWKNPIYWNQGPGALTKEGIRQHYKLGIFTRKRYGTFLPKFYYPNWFKAHTTDVDRTHMSCQSNLVGMFKPKENETWNKNLPWQPIPVHIIEKTILTPLPDCPIYMTEATNVLVNHYLYVALNQKFADLFAHLTKYSGETVTTVSSVYSIYDTLHIEDQLGFVLPNWTKPVYPEPMKSLSGYSFKAYAFTTEARRLATGSWLNTMNDYFLRMFAEPSSAEKFQMWSAHDFNIANILSTIGAFEPHYPAFASTLYFELRNKSGTAVVNIHHKDDDLDIFEDIKIKGCEFDCPLKRFNQLLSDYLIDAKTWRKECAASSTSLSRINDEETDEEFASVIEHVENVINNRII